MSVNSVYKCKIRTTMYARMKRLRHMIHINMSTRVAGTRVFATLAHDIRRRRAASRRAVRRRAARRGTYPIAIGIGDRIRAASNCNIGKHISRGRKSRCSRGRNPCFPILLLLGLFCFTGGGHEKAQLVILGGVQDGAIAVNNVYLGKCRKTILDRHGGQRQ